MKRIFSFIICLGIVTSCTAGVFADEVQTATTAPAEQTATETAATAAPEAETVAETLEPAAEPTPAPTPTPSPTATPEPAPKMNPFFCAMKNGSTFAYVDDGDTVKYVPMVASTNTSQIPDIVNDRTYLPFRYIFEELFGFNDKSKNQTEPLAIELNNNEYTYGFAGEDKVFTIKYKYNNQVRTLVNGEEKSVTDPRNGVTENMIVLNVRDGASYLPLVYFAAERLCNVGYNANTKYIYIADNDETIKTYSEKIDAWKYTNNFITQSDTVLKGSDVISVSKETGGWYRGASSNFNLAVFQNEDNKLQFLDLSNGISGPLVIDGDTSMLIDRAVIYGNRIFGLRVSEDNRRVGQLFEATLDVNSITYAQNTYNVVAKDYNVKVNNNVVMYNLQEEMNKNNEKVPIIYYVDVDEGYKLKRMEMDTRSVSEVAVNGEPIKNADYFAVGGGYIVYNDFAERKIKAVKTDGSGDIQTLAELGDMDIQFIIFDGKDSFCYIQTGTEPNEIKKITLTNGSFGEFETFFVAEPTDELTGRIRNISAFDGRIYANVNYQFKECK